MKTVVLALCGLLAAGSGAPAAAGIDGEYDSPLGRVRVSGDGTTYRGVLVEPSGACPFAAGDEVLRGTLLDDSIAGQVRVCLAGAACAERSEWSSAVLLATKDRLCGAVHVEAKGCRGPVGKNGGVVFARARPARPGGARAPRPSPAAGESGKDGRRARARTIMRDGATYLSEGNFEAARRRFLQAIDVDAGLPEAFNGVGVTYRMRDDLARALDWYKKALAVDPDFGDAYYNMACVYAVKGDRQLALRYLQIAALNGYATADGMDRDPDLEPVRGEAAYRALVRQRM